MRWFKHLTSARDDEVMAEILSVHGPAGYGIWWMILEIIGAQMEKGSDKCWATYPRKKWKDLCSIYHQSQFDLITISLASRGKLVLISNESRPDLLTISCPNLLKFRDEYSKKSGQTPDKKPKESGVCPEQDTETDTETDTEIKRLTSFPDGNGQRPSCPHKEIVALYHEYLPELSRVLIWSEKRQKALRARWVEAEERQDLGWWKAYFQLVKSSDFLLGKVSGRQWKCNLEWLVNLTNMLKVLEGQYTNGCKMEENYTFLDEMIAREEREKIEKQKGMNACQH